VRPKQVLVLLAVLVVGIGSGFLLGRGGSAAPDVAQAAAQQPAAQASSEPSSPTRTVLLTVDDPGNPGYDVVLGVVDFPAGADTGNHNHPGIEVGYILEGRLEMRHEGRAPEILTAGGSFHNNAPHSAMNVGSEPAKLVAVWIVEKGKPMAEPVP